MPLQWQFVDLPHGRVRVEHSLVEDVNGRLVLAAPKTRCSRRTIDLPEVAVEALTSHWSRSDCPKNGWVFPDRKGGPRRKSNLIRRCFKPLLKRAGLPDITFHSLRHIANPVLLAAGESPKVAAERLGHSTTRMTLDVYTHILPTTQRRAIPTA